MFSYTSTKTGNRNIHSKCFLEDRYVITIFPKRGKNLSKARSRSWNALVETGTNTRCTDIHTSWFCLVRNASCCEQMHWWWPASKVRLSASFLCVRMYVCVHAFIERSTDDDLRAKRTLVCFICLHVCICVIYMRVCMHLCTSLALCVYIKRVGGQYTRTQTYRHSCTPTQPGMRVCYVFVRARAKTHTQKRAHTHAYTHTCIHTHTQTHTHTHTWRPPGGPKSPGSNSTGLRKLCRSNSFWRQDIGRNASTSVQRDALCFMANPTFSSESSS